MELSEICNNISSLGAIYFITNIIRILCIVTPILLLLLLTIDFVRATASGDTEKMDKVKSKAVKRIAYALAVFLVPAIVNGFMGLLGDSTNFSGCYNLATSENVQKLADAKKIEQDLKKAQNDEQRKALTEARDKIYGQIIRNRNKQINSEGGTSDGNFPNEYIQATQIAEAAGETDSSTCADKSKDEVRFSDWRGGWDYVYRPKDPAKANKAATCMETAVKNNNIGYGRDGGCKWYDLWNYLDGKNNWDVSKNNVNEPVSVSCCPLVAVCLKNAGYTPPKDMGCVSNSEMIDAVKQAGDFQKVYPGTDLNLSNIRRGDVLFVEWSYNTVHMAMAV